MHNGPKQSVATEAGEQGAGVRGVQGGDLLGRAGTRVVLAAVAELRAQLVAGAGEGCAQLVPAPAAANTAAELVAAPGCSRTCTWRMVRTPRHRNRRGAEQCTEANNNVRPSVV